MEYLEQVKQPKRNYYSDCKEFAKVWISLQKNPFTSEDLINAYKEQSIKLPSEPRVWGAVMREMHKENRIEFFGFSKYKGKAGHMKPCNVWKRVK